MKTNTAFNYDTQRWVEGVEASALRRTQLEDELALLTGPNGERYAQFSGIADRQKAIDEIRRQIGGQS